jgi:phage terminase large subunit-like protein
LIPCGYVFDDLECEETGTHFCVPRADKAQAFFEEILVHTKGTYARKRFILEDWQRDEIIHPLFGNVVWSDEFEGYKRQYEIAWIEVGRKNGKALDVATPILTADGWKTMGEIAVGDYVHAADGSLSPVSFVSERHHRDCFSVKFADGAELIASDHHLWAVNDRLGGERVIDTVELFKTQTYGARGDRRYTVTVPDAIERPEANLPLDPYLFGAWLGDGSSTKAEFTSADPELWAAIESAGFALSYDYPAGRARTRGVLGMKSILSGLGVLGDKHVPDSYMLASRDQRLALLRGLMDTDGSVIVGPNTPRVEFCNTNRRLAESVLLLARSLGWKAALKESRAKIGGKDCGPRYRVCWTAYSDMAPFSLSRKASKLAARPERPTRASTNAVVSVTQVPSVETVCIQIDHPTHVFLAGESLTPTHNTELLAGIMLYLLVADGEESGEIYGVARDRKQAALAFDVAAQMVKFSPVLAKRLRITEYKKRIYDVRTNSFYEVIAADAQSALGSNPSGVGADEILAWPDGGMWDSMRTGMGSGARRQPLMVASTTAGNDTEGFAGQKHKEMQAIQDDPESMPHIFVYMRNTPMDADPWDEANWPAANPALGTFLSWDAMRKQAREAKNNPINEMGFRQFRLNQWQNSTVRWMKMHLYDATPGVKHQNAEATLEAFAGQECWFGFDLAARKDLCALCYAFPQVDGSVDLVWRFWCPEAAFDQLNRLNGNRFQKWYDEGWLTVTEGDVLDLTAATSPVYQQIEEDSKRFTILGGDCDKWSSDPVIQEIESRCYIREIFAYKNDFAHMSDGMHRVFEMVMDKKLRHHGNPLARFCFDSCEARVAAYDPNLIRPDIPDRASAAKRIDAVPAAVMAINAWYTRGQNVRSIYDTEDVFVLG